MKWSRSVVSDSLRPVDCSPPSSSVHGILQARGLEWGAIAMYNVVTHNFYRFAPFIVIIKYWLYFPGFTINIALIVSKNKTTCLQKFLTIQKIGRSKKKIKTKTLGACSWRSMIACFKMEDKIKWKKWEHVMLVLKINSHLPTLSIAYLGGLQIGCWL